MPIQLGSNSYHARPCRALVGWALTTGGDDESPPTVEGASFLVTDVAAANGLLDVIDRVLVP